MKALLKPTWQASVAARSGVGLDLDDGDLVAGGDGGGAPLGAVGEVEDLAEAAAGLDGGERLAQQRDADLALDQQVEAVALARPRG